MWFLSVSVSDFCGFYLFLTFVVFICICFWLVVFICICFWLLWFLSVYVPNFCGFYLYLFMLCGFWILFHISISSFDFKLNFIFNAIKLLKILFVFSFAYQLLKKFFLIFVRPKQDIQVGKRKFKQWWSTIKPISTKPTICFTSTHIIFFIIFISCILYRIMLNYHYKTDISVW